DLCRTRPSCLRMARRPHRLLPQPPTQSYRESRRCSDPALLEHPPRPDPLIHRRGQYGHRDRLTCRRTCRRTRPRLAPETSLGLDDYRLRPRPRRDRIWDVRNLRRHQQLPHAVPDRIDYPPDRLRIRLDQLPLQITPIQIDIRNIFIDSAPNGIYTNSYRD